MKTAYQQQIECDFDLWNGNLFANYSLCFQGCSSAALHFEKHQKGISLALRS
jgi:hypothetical protein